MLQPASVHIAADGTPFNIVIYDRQTGLNWNLFKGTELSSLQKAML
jgi:hypothetical protein